MKEAEAIVKEIYDLCKRDGESIVSEIAMLPPAPCDGEFTTLLSLAKHLQISPEVLMERVEALCLVPIGSIEIGGAFTPVFQRKYAGIFQVLAVKLWNRYA